MQSDIAFEEDCETQVRTLAEEVYGEFDHKVRYPYRDDNKFLARYNRIIAKVTSELDDLISTCSDLSGQNLDELDKMFMNDKYVEWQKKLKDAGTHLESVQDAVIPTKNYSSIVRYSMQRKN